MDATFERLAFATDESAPDRGAGASAAPSPAAAAQQADAILSDASVIDARSGGSLVLPAGDFALDAEWVREGGDLLMVGADGRVLTLAGYYEGAVPDLVTDAGSVLSPGLVAAVARVVAVAGSAADAAGGGASDGGMTDSAATSSGSGIDAPLQLAQLAGSSVAIGKVEEVKGTATSRGGGGGSGRLNVGDPIYQNDVIETGGGGAVTLRFNDTTKFSVGQNARMTLDKFVYDPGSGAGEMSVSVVKGVFRFVSGKVAHSAEDAMQVKLPVGTIGVRGTHVVGQADANGPNTRVTLLENP
ncbi:MAG: FecR domain-containing protein, partial [Alphaproteobacteria bacterium]|nr:FecR domain-containing protein [Alphaproteobacteria bacterium]